MKKFALLLAIFAIGLQSVLAQTTEITGAVTSAEDGTTLPGVTVTVKGTTLGTITDINGSYTMTVPENAEALVFSFVGMLSQEVAIGNSSTINVSMEPDVIGVDEVIVVGYGTATRQSFVGSASSVSSENLKSKSVSNLSQSLSGEVSGVRVINTSGQPGEDATIRVRGFGSVNGNRDPLYVIDGVPYSGALNAINPNDIESTTILKDATATAIYGSRGANGVILLTTKSGKAGESEIEVDVKTGINVSGLPRYSTIKSPEQYVELGWEAMYNRGVALNDPDPAAFASNNLFSASGITPKYNMWNVEGSQVIDPSTGEVASGVTRKYDPEDWEDYGFQSSSRTEVNLTMRGGSEKTKYFTSFGYLKDEGYIINSDFERYSATMNLNSEVKPWLNTTMRLSYTGTQTTNNGQSEDSGSIFWFVDNIPSIFPLFLRDENGEKIEESIYGGYEYDYGIGRGFGAMTNSIADAHYDLSRAKRHQVSGNFNATIDILPGLTFENTLGAQYYADKDNDLRNPFYGSAASNGGYLYRVNEMLTSYNLTSIVRYKKEFDSHNLEAMVAHETYAWEQQFETISKNKAVVPGLAEFNNFVVTSPPHSYADEVKLESYFGQVNYSYDEKYYASASVRRDGSSRFEGSNRWDTFGSLGLSWVISKESFMSDLPFVDYLKYKISYGLVGEQEGIGYYPTHTLYNVDNLNDEISISEDKIGNKDLTWEKSKMFQTGIEYGFGNIVDGSIVYYVKNTDNLLFDRRVGASIGYPLLTVNDGLLRNSGLEFDITAHILDKSDYGLDITLNGEILSNELTEMPVDPSTGGPKVIDIDGRFGRSEGHSLYDFYVREWAGVDPADGVGMWYQYYDDANDNNIVDVDEDAEIDEGIKSMTEYLADNPDANVKKKLTKKYADATQKYVDKSAIPDVRGGLRIAGFFKNFDVSAQFLYSIGGYSYDFVYANLMDNAQVGSNNWSTDILDRWQEPGDITNVPRLSSGFDTNVSRTSTRFITKSDYLALNNLQIGYTFPETITDKLGVNSLNLFVSGDNLFLLSARDGFNPSTDEAGTSDNYRYSPLSTYTVGLNIKF